ncbi:GNAT family N-acetyltransferase [Ramlibacter rhizophilus]|uniref:GNAT family N-acetyltransferase n=1 Tax=Ramlibacter rhizophilus TaxID=1781167 RepID=UPI0014323B78|nr:GNAT family protein [Ramlibacter rhizophilus]
MTIEAQARALLRPLRDEDSDTLFRWINDRETVVFNAPFHPVTRADHERWFERVRRDPSLRIFAIDEVPGGRLVGSAQLLDISPLHRSAQLQIRIGEADARGRGIGTEAVRLLLAQAWGELGLHRVALTVRADNARAIRAYEKCGFVREGLLRDAALIEGRYVDLVCMGVLSP